jgi:hypothetical protein
MATVTQKMVDAAWLVVDRFATTKWASEIKNLMQSAEMGMARTKLKHPWALLR